jgi:tetratricopeptide (TPR) repeat protein
MKLFARLLLGCSIAAAMMASPAVAAKVALVIGNADYANSPLLDNPLRDARIVAETFEKLGFETIVAENLTQRDFADALLKFEEALVGAEVAAFYYAGHGIQYEGQNYLVSIDAELDNPFMLPGETIGLERIIQTMEAHSPLNMLFIDACRRNQFATRLSRGPTPVAQGLAPATALEGDTLVMYATASNEVAYDGTEDNSPFAHSLVQHLPAPDTELGIAMKRVIRDVREATSGLQSPEMLTNVAIELYLNESPEAKALGLLEGDKLLLASASASDADRKLLELLAEGERHRLASEFDQYLVALLHARNLASWYFGENSIQYAEASNRLVGALTEMGRLDDAIYASIEAIRVFSLIEGETSTQVLNEKLNLAGRLRTVNRHDDAARLIAEVIMTYETGVYSADEMIFYVYALQAYADHLSEQGLYQKALEITQRALDIELPATALKDEVYGYLLLTHARQLAKLGQCSDAADHATRAAEILSEVGFTEVDVNLADALRLAGGKCA